MERIWYDNGSRGLLPGQNKKKKTETKKKQKQKLITRWYSFSCFARAKKKKKKKKHKKKKKNNNNNKKKHITTFGALGGLAFDSVYDIK